MRKVSGKLTRTSFFVTLALCLMWIGMRAVFAAPSAKAGVGARAVKSESASKSALSAEGFSIQARIEDLISRRVSHELGTRLDRSAFTVSTFVTVSEDRKDEKKAAPTSEELAAMMPEDFLSGDLSPEEMGLTEDETQGLRSLLSKYSIQKIRVAVGLKDAMPESSVKETEKWLSDRLNREFGSRAEVSATSIQPLPEKPEPPKPERTLFQKILDGLKDYQQLAGQMFMSAAVLMAALLWRRAAMGVSGGSGSDARGLGASGGASGAGAGASGAGTSGAGAGVGAGASGAGGASGAVGRQAGESELQAENERAPIVERVRQLCVQTGGNLKSVVQGWSDEGESGLQKLAALMEMLSGSELAPSIPQEIGEQLAPQFEVLSSKSARDRVEIYKKAYWDLVSFRSVGPGALFKPFSYLTRMKQDEVKSLIMNQNPRMKALVALSMPDEARRRLMQNLSAEEKRALIEVSMQLDEVPAEEIRSADQSLKSLSGGEDEVRRMLDAQPMLLKLLGSLPVRDEMAILAEVEATMPGVLERIREAYPSIAFLGSWTDESMGTLLQSSTADEILSLIQVKPQWESRLLSLCPGTLAAMVQEDRAGGRVYAEDELEKQLGVLQARVREMLTGEALRQDRLYSKKSEDAVTKQAS